MGFNRFSMERHTEREVVEEISTLNRNLADTVSLLEHLKTEVATARADVEEEKAKQDESNQEMAQVARSLKEKRKERVELSASIHGDLQAHSHQLDFAESELQNKLNFTLESFLVQLKNFEQMNTSINTQIEEVRLDLQKDLKNAARESKALELAAAEAREGLAQRCLRLKVRYSKEEAFLRCELQEKDKRLSSLREQVKKMEEKALTLQYQHQSEQQQLAQQQQQQQQEGQFLKRKRTTAVRSANQHHRPGHQSGGISITTTPGSNSASSSSIGELKMRGQQYSFEGFRTGTNATLFYD